MSYRPIKVAIPTDMRKRVCRICDEPIQNEAYFSIRNVRAGGSWIDVNMHDSCFKEEAERALHEMEKIRK